MQPTWHAEADRLMTERTRSNGFANLSGLNYLTGNQVARRIGATDTTVYNWLTGKAPHGIQNGSPRFWIPCGPNAAEGLLRPVTSIGNTRIGEGSRSHDDVRSAKRLRARFGR